MECLQPRLADPERGEPLGTGVGIEELELVALTALSDRGGGACREQALLLGTVVAAASQRERDELPVLHLGDSGMRAVGKAFGVTMNEAFLD